MPKRTMPTLQDFYNARVTQAGDQALAYHVGHTLGGQPLPPEVLEQLGAQMWQLLDLGPEDHLLDLCCGNGIFSRMAAARGGSVTGLDFSDELIRVAKAATAPQSLHFLTGDVWQLDQLTELQDKRYPKVLMNAALQHFEPRRFARLLDQILAVTTEAPVILFALVPERGKERAFFDTPQKRLRHRWARLTGRDRFGYWWGLEDVRGPAAARGLIAEAIPVALSRPHPYAAYRMHLRLKPLSP